MRKILLLSLLLVVACAHKTDSPSEAAPTPVQASAPNEPSPPIERTNGACPKPPETAPNKNSAKKSDDSPTIDKEAIRRTIRDHLREVGKCYRPPLLEGKIVISFEVVPPGCVSHLKIKSSTFAAPALAECLADLAITWKYPAPPDGMTAEVSYPFRFKPNDTDKK